ncbi:MAG: Unknown protein [uncultured Sulfurovum sp.]|uniref:Uncharacterized protein n=1 Tax=uncultured Sulfurovum sp. TaxID=269237 RepID=A0A6S6SD21_9BACT|nr:MAG: Unknown protein [uncultured Sulfurovum sp.]
MQKSIVSFEIVNPSEALLEQLKTILQSFKQVNNISFSHEKAFLDEFKESIQEVKKVTDGDKSLLYNGSLDDMLLALK